MGLSEKIAQFLSKFFKPQEGWELHLQESDIEQMEAQGVDVTEIKAKRAAHLAAKEAAETKIKEDSLNALDMAKLQPYLATPRDATSQFITDALAFNKQKEKQGEKFANAPIVYCHVVQAGSHLWKPGHDAPGGVVYVFTMDETHMHDEVWLKNIASKVADVRYSGQVPKASAKLMELLNNFQSKFCMQLDASLVGDAIVWCATYDIAKPKDTLPLGYLPYTKIVPMFLMENPKENRFVQLENVPLSYYTK